MSKNLKIGYVRLDNRKNVLNKEKIKIFCRKLIIKVSKEKVDDGFIFLVPKYKKYTEYIKNKIFKQLIHYIIEENIEYIVLEEGLKQLFSEENLQIDKIKQTENFKQNDLKILNGKIIMKKSIFYILEYIFNISKINMNLQNIYVFVNKYNQENINIIEDLSTKFKTINIITKNVRQFQILEKKLYNEGILITVSNNRRKSARNAKYIINIDFDKEIFEKYNINTSSIILNLTNEKIFFEKCFQGILINNIDIDFDNDCLEYINEYYGGYRKNEIMESFIIGKQYNIIKRFWKNYNCKISKLIGIRGEIQINEF